MRKGAVDTAVAHGRVLDPHFAEAGRLEVVLKAPGARACGSPQRSIFQIGSVLRILMQTCCPFTTKRKTALRDLHMSLAPAIRMQVWRPPVGFKILILLAPQTLPCETKTPLRVHDQNCARSLETSSCRPAPRAVETGSVTLPASLLWSQANKQFGKCSYLINKNSFIQLLLNQKHSKTISQGYSTPKLRGTNRKKA